MPSSLVKMNVKLLQPSQSPSLGLFTVIFFLKMVDVCWYYQKVTDHFVAVLGIARIEQVVPRSVYCIRPRPT